MGWFDVGNLLSIIIVLALVLISFRKKTLIFIYTELDETMLGDLAKIVLEIRNGEEVDNSSLAVFGYIILYMLLCIILYFVITLLSYIILFILLVYLIAIIAEKILKKK